MSKSALDNGCTSNNGVMSPLPPPYGFKPLQAAFNMNDEKYRKSGVPKIEPGRKEQERKNLERIRVNTIR